MTGLELKALVPVSVRADAERGALGNRVAAVYAPLPVGVADPIGRFRAVHDAMRGLKAPGRPSARERIAALAGFASPDDALPGRAPPGAASASSTWRSPTCPGPQFPLYLLGRRLAALYPLVPLAENTALGVAIMSYDGSIDFGLRERLRRAARPRRAGRRPGGGDPRARGRRPASRARAAAANGRSPRPREPAAG